jgi:hypothetical protein
MGNMYRILAKIAEERSLWRLRYRWNLREMGHGSIV